MKIETMENEVKLRKKQHECKHPSWMCPKCHLFKNNPITANEYDHIIEELFLLLDNMSKMYCADDKTHKENIEYVIIKYDLNRLKRFISSDEPHC